MKRRAKHTPGCVNMDVCGKCGMSGLQQVQNPHRQCRPAVSKRRQKKGVFMFGIRVMPMRAVKFNDNWLQAVEPVYEYIPDPEITALKKRVRIIEKTEMIGKGISPRLAEIILDKRDEAMEAAVTKLFMEGSQPEGSGGGILALLEDA